MIPIIIIVGIAAAICGGRAAHARTPPCPADIAPIASGGDGIVNAADLLAVINQWGPCPAPPASCAADIAPVGSGGGGGGGGDGAVNVADLLLVINSWGPCPSPCASGTWASTPAAVYNCAFGLVNFNITQWIIMDNGTTMSVSGSGLPGPMTGAAVACEPGRTFTVSKTLAGSCTETYTLSGVFSSANQFTGTFTAAFTPGSQGACMNCTIHSWNITATRQ